MQREMLTLIAAAMVAAPTVLADDFSGFGPRTAVVVQNQGALQIEMTDLDMDGDVDAMMSGLTGITTLLNDGLGGFGNEVFYPSQSYSDRRFIVEDLNGDGFPDIVSVDLSANGIEVRLNQGDGTMGPRITVPGGWSSGDAPRIAAADVDGDGDLDIVITPNTRFESVYVYTNDGNGGLSLDQVIPAPAGSEHAKMAVGDANGDGSPDIIHISRYNNNNNDYRITTYLNDGAGSFSPDVISTGIYAISSKDTKLVDVDGDGDLDLLLSSQANLVVVKNNGSGFFSGLVNYPAVSPAPQAELAQIAVADINGDTLPDLAVGDSRYTKRTFVYCNNGAGGFATPEIYYNSEGSGDVSSQAVALADIDGNSTPDLLTGSRENGSGTSYFNSRLNQTDVVEPGVFALIGPADAASGLSLPENITGWGIEAPRFSWGQPTGFQTSYDLAVMTVNPPVVEVFSASGIQERSLLVPSGVLESGTQYQWMVTAVNQVGSTDASSIFTFTTAEGPRLCEPDLNGDGLVNYFDISAFLNAYTAGCN